MVKSNTYIKTYGFKQVGKNITEAQKKLIQTTITVLNKYSVLILGESKKLAPHGYSGNLKSSLQIAPLGIFARWIGSNLNYTASVEKGTRPHNIRKDVIYSKQGALYKWVKAKIGGTEDEIERITYLVALKIRAYGTPNTPFLSASLYKFYPFFLKEIQQIAKMFGRGSVVTGKP